MQGARQTQHFASLHTKTLLYHIILSKVLKVIENEEVFALIKSSMLERKKKSCKIDTNTYIMNE